MLMKTISIRVRYGETDQMGVVYHGNYAAYCEVARVEFFRQIGMSYKGLEDSGIMLPVVELNMKYLKPAFYDELLTIETSIPETPTGVKIKFEYKIYNSNNELLTEAYSVLAFVDKETRKPLRCPKAMTELIGSLNQKQV